MPGKQSSTPKKLLGEKQRKADEKLCKSIRLIDLTKIDKALERAMKAARHG